MFQTFTAKKKSTFRLGNLLFILLIISAIAVIFSLLTSTIPMFYKYRNQFNELSFSLNLILVGMLIINALHYVFVGRNKNLRPLGNLTLENETIIFNDEKVQLSEVKEIRFIGNDIKGEFRGFISKGTNNELIIKLKNNQEKYIRFRQTKENTLKSKKSILEFYNHLGVLSSANLQNILNNTNYY